MKKRPVTHVMNVGVAALAREIGMSESSVSRKMKAGQTPEQIRQHAANRKGAPHSTKGPGRPAKPSEYDMIIESRSRYEAMEEAKLRRQKALADRQEIENMLRRGELIPLAYMRKWTVRFLVDARSELEKGPSELQDTMAAESDPVKCAAILRTWVDRVLEKYYQLDRMWGKGSERDYAEVAS